MYAEALEETRPGPEAAPAAGWRTRAAEALLRQRGHLLLWAPLCLACGIGGYFALPFEPGAAHYQMLLVCVAVLIWIAHRAPEAVAPAFLALAVAGLGAGAAGLRAHSVAAPVLEFRYYGPVEGRIVGMDRSASGALRLTLDRVRLEDVAPGRTTRRVRLALHGDQDWVTPAPGLTVMATAHLSPPGGPVEPGGFDFARKAWFEGLGAVGYSRSPVLMAAPAETGARLIVFRVRMALSAAIRTAVPGERGAFAAAILTGDRSAIPADALEDLRGANLAHLLAISGLHMGLLTGVVFGAIRGALALVPWLALRLPGKKIAAVGALAAGAAYLALSGASVATVRAFVMVSVVLVAVLLDRRAISLRSVAIAACLILLITPEALSGPGFQMSFAATVALVTAFAALRDRLAPGRMPRWVLPLATLFVSSAVAGFATAPIAAAHFNRITDYGLIANLLAVPAMGAVVMPSAVAAAVLAPFGLEAPALWLMGQGIGWILAVAAWVSGLDGAITPVVAPPAGTLPLLALGALFVLLWQGRIRWLGLVPVCAAFVLWGLAERPVVLVAPSGGLVGVIGPEGRALSKARGDSFAAAVWLENDGDAARQAAAAARPGLKGAAGDLQTSVGGLTLRHISGRGRDDRAAAACTTGIVIVNTALDPPPGAACTWFDTRALRRTGALAVYLRHGEPVLRFSNDRSAARLWHVR